MNILLINPASPNIARISTGFDLEISNSGRFPPIGLLFLAAYIRKHSKHNVKIIDMEVENFTNEGILHFIKEYNTDIIGITSFTYTFYDVLQLTCLVKEYFEHISIVLGGPNIQLFGKEVLSHSEIDYIVNGEGEESFLYLIDKIEKKEIVGKDKGIGFRNNGEIFIGNPTWIKNLDDLPFPAYDLINADNYYSTFGYGGKTITLCTSRGCPYLCTYCQVLSKKYRTHSISYIIDNIKLFYVKGYRNFYFFDDTFNINSKRVIDLSKAIKSEKLDIKWIFRGRVNSINEELCKEASMAGCVQILFGIEDYNNEGLKKIKKNITIEQATSAIKLAKKYNIKTSTNWIIGLPNHKKESDLDNLINVAIKMGSDYAMFSILQLLPGCEMFEDAANDGVINRDSWSEYIHNPTPSCQIEFYDKYINSKVLSRYHTKSYKMYYRRSGYILKNLLSLRSFSELKNKLPVAINVLLARRR